MKWKIVTEVKLEMYAEVESWHDSYPVGAVLAITNCHNATCKKWRVMMLKIGLEP